MPNSNVSERRDLLARTCRCYVSRIFGERKYMMLDHVEQLPDKLLVLYAGLAR